MRPVQWLVGYFIVPSPEAHGSLLGLIGVPVDQTHTVHSCLLESMPANNAIHALRTPFRRGRQAVQLQGDWMRRFAAETLE